MSSSQRPLPVPLVEHGSYIPGWNLNAPFALCYDAPIPPVQRCPHALNRLSDILLRAEWQDMLPVNLSPECDFASELISQSLNVHAKELRIDGVYPDFDEVRVDVLNKAVGVEEDVFSPALEDIAIVSIEGLED